MENGNNINDTWNVIILLKIEQGVQSTLNTLEKSNLSIYDQKETANEFNNFLCKWWANFSKWYYWTNKYGVCEETGE